MRNLILSLVLLQAIGASAQPTAAATTPEGSNWLDVQAMPTGQSISVKTRDMSANCKIRSVNADALTCTQKKDIVFQRANVLQIRIPRRGRAALIGAGVGALGLGLTGFVSSTNNNQGWFGPNFLRGPVTTVFTVAGGLIGAGVGAGTDFSRSTVYKAP